MGHCLNPCTVKCHFSIELKVKGGFFWKGGKKSLHIKSIKYQKPEAHRLERGFFLKC